MYSTQTSKQSSLWVAPLSNFRSDDISLAGGKGANLGELTNIGLSVPPGFVITTTAYDSFLQTTGVQEQLHAVLTSLQIDNSESVAEVGRRMQDIFRQSALPGELTDEILEAYRLLGDSAVAVRSSATAEDLPDAAFAGQQETFLNVVGEQPLLDAIRDCWASLWSERAILYRARQNIDQNTVKLAVVVQKMVSADAAGVMFTANPVSGDRGELIIDANLGLGEAVVGGLVTPDHLVIDKRTRRIKEKLAGRKEIVIRAKAGGGTEQIHSTQEGSNSFALPLEAVVKLSGLGIDIERHYSTPQDIEWAWIQGHSKRGNFFILQTRPVTALPEPIKVSGPMRLVLPMLAEMWPIRPYPLDMTTFTGAIERAIGNLLVAMIGKSAPNPDESFLEEDGVVVQFKPPQIHPSPSMLITPWITLWRTRHKELTRWEEDPTLIDYIANVHDIEQRDPGSLTWKQNIETIHETMALIPGAMELRERYIPKTLPGLAGLWLLLSLVRHVDRFGTLVSGVKTKTTETNRALEDLAEQIRTRQELRELFAHYQPQELRTALQGSEAGRSFLQQFQIFLTRFGHRETSLTISQPAWKDNPDGVLAILKVLAETEPKTPESYDGWQRTRDDLLTHSVLGTFMFRNIFLKYLTNARYLFQIREDTHFYATMVQPILRRVALELGKRLVQAGALDVMEDVFYLRLDELEALGESWPSRPDIFEQTRSLVGRRKAKRESLSNTPVFDSRLLASTAHHEEGVLLSGTSGSPGSAHGPARIIQDLSQFGKLQAGDVLVAPVTNPAWTPLFQRAAAVVVDTGGLASHAAIVAREYGIPAVMGTINGTQKLEDGQLITVDGSRGLVLRGEDPK